MILDDALMDFDADARDRIKAWLTCHDCGALAKTLAPSIRRAGAQLELMKPAVFGTSAKGVYIGACANIPPGSLLVVLANRVKVFQMGLKFSPDTPPPAFLTAIQECVDYVQANLSETPEAGGVMIAVDDFITKLGSRVAKTEHKTLSQEHYARIVGLLFGILSAEQLAGMQHAIEAMIERDLCPALIGLTGPGSRSGHAAAWPICFPLAPYLESVIPPERVH